MSDPITRRSFAALTAGLVVGQTTDLLAADEKPKPATGPVEAAFKRDYAPPKFQPSWRRPQINRQLVQDWVIFAHMDLDMVKKLLDKEAGLINSIMDWGGGDWESALGAAAHMGRRDIAEFLLEKEARIDIFCAAMLGQLDAVAAFINLEPKLIDAKGPHGFSLHFHAKVGGKQAEPVLEYLQSVKKIELKEKDKGKDKK